MRARPKAYLCVILRRHPLEFARRTGTWAVEGRSSTCVMSSGEEGGGGERRAGTRKKGRRVAAAVMGRSSTRVVLRGVILEQRRACKQHRHETDAVKGFTRAHSVSQSTLCPTRASDRAWKGVGQGMEGCGAGDLQWKPCRFTNSEVISNERLPVPPSFVSPIILYFSCYYLTVPRVKERLCVGQPPPIHLAAKLP